MGRRDRWIAHGLSRGCLLTFPAGKNTSHGGSWPEHFTPRTTEERTPDASDPILGEGGYPSEAELQRIREWSWEGGFRPLMDYVRKRWMYANHGYWSQEGDRFSISTAGWSGNEDIIAALEANQMFSMLCPVSWRTGGHYVYDVQAWTDDEPRQLVRDPATPLGRFGSVIAFDGEREAAAATLSLPDEWLLSISMMEAARRIDMEIPVGHSWREVAMLTNVILADQYRAASSEPSKGEPR